MLCPLRRPVGEAVEFHTFENSIDIQVINSVTASRKYYYTLQRAGASDIWLMDLPK